MGYGYGLNVTVLQLANAYATIADGGVMHTPTFIKGGDNRAKADHRAEDGARTGPA